MNEENEAQCPAPTMEPPRNMLAGAGMDCAKEARPRDVSYIDREPDNQVVLSKRLEYLARRVGGCQTDELLALLRRIMYEVISQRKY